MKHIYIICLCITSIGYSQIPTNYYDSANALSGFALKTELNTIITSGYVDQGDAMLLTGFISTYSDDIVASGYENDNSILLYYTENPNGIDPYNYTHGSNICGTVTTGGSCYNRDRIVPQSAFGGAFPMKTDLHHVTPSDGFINNQRGSLPFGIVGTADWTSQNGTKRGTSNVAGYSGIVFEPIDEFKGDIARAILYFVTRYENTVDNYTSFPMFNGTENQALSNWAVTMLLDWHNNIDPVDQREIDRNIAAYNYQGNANPFVDHPEYVNMIWVDTQAPTNPSNLLASNPTDNSIDLTWTASTDDIAVTFYDIYIDGTFSFSTSNTSASINSLIPATSYCFTIRAKDAANNESGFSNQACEATTNMGIANTDCVIETFENITTSSSSYSNVSWTGNDGGAWNATDARTDRTLNASKVIAIRNGVIERNGLNLEAVESLTVTTVREFAGSTGTFDLVINGTLVGTIPYGENPLDITIPINLSNVTSVLINNNSVNSNIVIFENLTITCSALSLPEYNLNNIKLHPNPVKNNLTVHLKNNTDTLIEIYNILGKRVFKNSINKTSNLNLQDLKTGIYIVKISQDNATLTKKLVKE